MGPSVAGGGSSAFGGLPSTIPAGKLKPPSGSGIGGSGIGQTTGGIGGFTGGSQISTGGGGFGGTTVGYRGETTPNIEAGRRMAEVLGGTIQNVNRLNRLFPK
ncbi:MAG: hypothetical protein ACYTBZ_24385 [Planctomycetota bacterium]|jgi:hypothetical protein